MSNNKINIRGTLKMQNNNFNYNMRFQGNKKNDNKKISNRIEIESNLDPYINNKTNCFNNIINPEQVYLYLTKILL